MRFLLLHFAVGLAHAAFPCDSAQQYIESVRLCLQSPNSTFYTSLFFRLFSGHEEVLQLDPSPLSSDSDGIVACGPILFVWPLKSLLESKIVVHLLRLGTLLGLGSFQANTTNQRLLFLTVGVSCAMLVLCSSLCHPNAKQRSLKVWGLTLGKLALVSSRVWLVSFAPAWWSVQSNSIVIAVAAIATLHKIVGDHSQTSSEEPSSKCHTGPSSVVSGLGLASLVYVSNAVFGEVSVVTRWTVNGFPNTGPMPYPWGAVVLLALFCGVWLSPCYHVTLSPVWWMIGGLSFTALYLLDTWAAFWGGVLLAVYTTSLWPPLLELASRCRPAPTLCLMGLVYVLEILFSVWTVAFNFVPGGVYTREHTGWLIAFVMATLGMALISCRKHLLKKKSSSSFIDTSSGKMPNASIHMCLCVLLLLGLGGFVYRSPHQARSHPDILQPKADFSAAVWTFHFGYDNEGWPSMVKAARMLHNTGADVIALLESDASKPFLGNNDLGVWLGEELGMHVDFGVSTRDHTWGNLLLSKYPIVKSEHIMLPSPEGEIAPAIVATVNMTGSLVDFVTTHMGNDRDKLDRRLQAKQLAMHLKQAKNPVVFLGYVTSEPYSSEYEQLTRHGNVLDIDSTDLDRWCEYIFYRGLIKLGYARISRAKLSDTEVQMARFRIPVDPHQFKDNTRVVIDPALVQEKFRFYPRFGTFKMGHNSFLNHSYHMDTPKYFIP